LTGRQNIELFVKNNLFKSNYTYENFLSHELLRKKVRNYSYGQRKKLSIVIALLKDTRYLFLDEVTNGLDYDSICFLKSEIKRISCNKTVVLTGHHFEFYNEILDDILLIKDNKLIHLEDAANRNASEDETERGKILEKLYKENF